MIRELDKLWFHLLRTMYRWPCGARMHIAAGKNCAVSAHHGVAEKLPELKGEPDLPIWTQSTVPKRARELRPGRLPVQTVVHLHRLLGGDVRVEEMALRFIAARYGAKNLLQLPPHVAKGNHQAAGGFHPGGETTLRAGAQFLTMNDPRQIAAVIVGAAKSHQALYPMATPLTANELKSLPMSACTFGTRKGITWPETVTRYISRTSGRRRSC